MSVVFTLRRERDRRFDARNQSSITDLIQILTSSSYEDESFDGYVATRLVYSTRSNAVCRIPELVDVINLQPTG